MNQQELEAKIDIVLYDLESEVLVDMDKVHKGVLTGAELGRKNQASARRALEAILALFAAETDRLIKDIESKLPEKLNNTNSMYVAGYTDHLDQTRLLLSSYRRPE